MFLRHLHLCQRNPKSLISASIPFVAHQKSKTRTTTPCPTSTNCILRLRQLHFMDQIVPVGRTAWQTACEATILPTEMCHMGPVSIAHRGRLVNLKAGKTATNLTEETLPFQGPTRHTLHPLARTVVIIRRTIRYPAPLLSGLRRQVRAYGH